ncbi:hypothetical protein COEREDRAFT_88614 [Coemansia reversa NRRL 1564]|uniref:Uncharacterized protein n=1 Tax=Coemansia reversa (strain ATCC 12441 / NRRL 1564) TaxID=763665 RepID=A0A2G5B713_COERN|nr:hypothetical protein COEREDRAFT_88614 [Coemansia reversa NRRL 1564]|eukprot:PIA14517.1 hypothetical protein COEREDRAFT_88614 [Coemansia reversa NRRL 1564]
MLSDFFRKITLGSKREQEEVSQIFVFPTFCGKRYHSRGFIVQKDFSKEELIEFLVEEKLPPKSIDIVLGLEGKFEEEEQLIGFLSGSPAIQVENTDKVEDIQDKKYWFNIQSAKYMVLLVELSELVP